MNNLESYFNKFRNNIVGINQKFKSPYGENFLLYADWIASGRLYKPIEEKICNEFGPFVGNTHSESSITGTSMTQAYHYALKFIKNHVNANEEDIIIATGSGMTKVINKLQRILGLKVCEQLKCFVNFPKELKPIVFVSHMEHHSNHTSWLETVADVVVIPPNDSGLIDIQELENKLEQNKNRKLIIGSFTACSNVTGIRTPIHQLAKIMHHYGGFCFVDYACSAPYEKINMHPDGIDEKLDAIFFSPHKFLGGPGSSGILIFNSNLYKNKIPDDPGGGTVDWTNPWGEYKFVNNIELREDGGTPPFLQTIKAALSIKLKEEMGIENILNREEELVHLIFNELKKISRLNILAGNIEDRIGAISFYVENIHYNLIVKLLNDKYGIQSRGGCSCAGTYGHYLLHVDKETSKRITDKINHGDLSEKPGWVRISLHPTMKNDEVLFICNSIKEIIININKWKKDYDYSSTNNEFTHKDFKESDSIKIENWFKEF